MLVIQLQICVVGAWRLSHMRCCLLWQIQTVKQPHVPVKTIPDDSHCSVVAWFWNLSSELTVLLFISTTLRINAGSFTFPTQSHWKVKKKKRIWNCNPDFILSCLSLFAFWLNIVFFEPKYHIIFMTMLSIKAVKAWRFTAKRVPLTGDSQYCSTQIPCAASDLQVI